MNLASATWSMKKEKIQTLIRSLLSLDNILSYSILWTQYRPICDMLDPPPYTRNVILVWKHGYMTLYRGSQTFSKRRLETKATVLNSYMCGGRLMLQASSNKPLLALNNCIVLYLSIFIALFSEWAFQKRSRCV